jgi:hypothetical protein
MKLINHTAYNGRDLRALIRLVAAEELNPGQLDHLQVEVFYRRAPGCRDDRRWRVSGLLSPGTGLKYNRFIVRLSRPERGGGHVELLGWPCTLMAHEMAECRGKKHASLYGTSRYGYRGRHGSYWQRRLRELHFPGLRVKPKTGEKTGTPTILPPSHEATCQKDAAQTV